MKYYRMILGLLVTGSLSATLDSADALHRLERHLTILVQRCEHNPELFGKAMGVIKEFFIACSYNQTVNHWLAKQCIYQLLQSTTINPVVQTWRFFKLNMKNLEDTDLFLEEFSLIIFVIYHGLIETMQLYTQQESI